MHQVDTVPEVFPGIVIPIGWKRAVQLRVENPGINAKELSKEIGVNQATILLWIKSPHFQAYENWVLKKLPPEQSTLIEAAKKENLIRVRERVETYLDEMEDRLRTILETTPDEKLQVHIIQDLFDRSGFVSQKEQSRQQAFVVTADAMQEFLNRANEAGITAGAIRREIAGRSHTGSSSSGASQEVVEAEVLDGHS